MSEARIDHLLDELVEPFESRSDGWDDVLSRASRTRSRYILVAAAAAALLLVPTAVALRGEITGLFQGTPPPPEISQSFSASNRMADMAARDGFANRFPHADVSKAHGVIEIQTPDGPLDVWAAPDDAGGQCWWIDFADDPAGPGGKYGYGVCDTNPPDAPDIEPGITWLDQHPELSTLFGLVHGEADRVVVELVDGTIRSLPVVEGAFVDSLAKGARLEHITAYNGDDQVASWKVRVG